MDELHTTVMRRETVEGLAPSSQGRYVDATCGLGGHSELLCEMCGPHGQVLSIDRDPIALEHAQRRLSRFGNRSTTVQGDFSSIEAILEEVNFRPVDGVLADLGVSSLQLDDPHRGFSFQSDGPLDMRMGPEVGVSAAEFLEGIDQAKLADCLRNFGEERRAKRIARAILQARDDGKLTSTRALAEVIERASGGRRAGQIHPATRAFQAIRIAVNREIDELEGLLSSLAKVTRPDGRVAIISFHSLEDRVVKHVFQDPPVDPALRGLPVEPVRLRGPWEALTRKPLTPSREELEANPRSRSAKLRIARRRRPDEEVRS